LQQQSNANDKSNGNGNDDANGKTTATVTARAKMAITNTNTDTNTTSRKVSVQPLIRCVWLAQTYMQLPRGMHSSEVDYEATVLKRDLIESKQQQKRASEQNKKRLGGRVRSIQVFNLPGGVGDGDGGGFGFGGWPLTPEKHGGWLHLPCGMMLSLKKQLFVPPSYVYL
jgi:hypothetical protein